MSKMSKNIFKVGDLVRLKSNGPEMTVVGEDFFADMGTTPYEAYKCNWFTKQNVQMKGSFPADALEKVVKTSKSSD